MNKNSHGFSLLEAILSLAILSFLAVTCFSTYQLWYQKKVLTESADRLVRSLNFAKSLSTVTGKIFYVCPSVNHLQCSQNGQGDLVIFTAPDSKEIENIVQILPPVNPVVTIQFAGFKQEEPAYFMNNGEFANNGHFTIHYQGQTLALSLSNTGIVRKNDSG